MNGEQLLAVVETDRWLAGGWVLISSQWWAMFSQSITIAYRSSVISLGYHLDLLFARIKFSIRSYLCESCLTDESFWAILFTSFCDQWTCDTSFSISMWDRIHDWLSRELQAAPEGIECAYYRFCLILFSLQSMRDSINEIAWRLEGLKEIAMNIIRWATRFFSSAQVMEEKSAFSLRQWLSEDD